jgi:hypothetical protein
MTDELKPDMPDLSELHDRMYGKPSAPSQNTPTEAEIEAVIKDLWLKTKISVEAQNIRASLNVDSGKHTQGEGEFLPDYVWDLVDVAIQTALNENAPSDVTLSDERIIELAEKHKIYPMVGDVSGVQLYQSGNLIAFTRECIRLSANAGTVPDYVRGLEDAAKLCEDAAEDARERDLKTSDDMVSYASKCIRVKMRLMAGSIRLLAAAPRPASLDDGGRE